VSTCAKCGQHATVIIVDPGLVVRNLCRFCFDQEQGREAWLEPVPLTEYHLLTEKGGEDADS
jgi:hypothetical protein